MAKSKAKKAREHLVRNGRRDPNLNRGLTPEISMHERKLPTLRAKLDKQENKYKHKMDNY